ncbi:MAG: FkbM family methyltransferase [Sphingomonadaceae bacterium]|nr:FkbM family methyltransferase [Sphingomonadaceae bacterium]
MYVDTTDVGIAPHLMLDGYWEMWVTEILASLTRPGMVVADVGANVGYFTLLMADICGPSGRVFAFEPNPRIAELLQRTVTLNGFWPWVSIHTDPLSDVDGASVDLIVPVNDPKNAHIVSSPEGQGQGIPVVTQRFDSKEVFRTVEMAKIDVEGAEEAVWRGMTAMLNGSALKTVVIEFAAARYIDPEGFLSELTSHGFAMSYISFKHGIRNTNIKSVLQQNPLEDIMLLLRR